MTKTDGQIEVTTAIATIAAMAGAECAGFGDGYKQIGVNISLPACDAAAEITGVDRTFCRMLNHKFRSDAAAMMFGRARAALALAEPSST